MSDPIVIPEGAYGLFLSGCAIIPKEMYEYLLKRDAMLSRIRSILLDDITLIDEVTQLDTGV